MPLPRADDAIDGSRAGICDTDSASGAVCCNDSDRAGGSDSFLVSVTIRARASGFIKSKTDLPGSDASPRIAPLADGCNAEDFARSEEDFHPAVLISASVANFDDFQSIGIFGGGYLLASGTILVTDNMNPSNGRRPS